MILDQTPDSDYLLVGKGNTYFNRFDADGVGTGLRHLGNVDTLEIGTEDDVIQKFSSMSADAPLYKKVARRRDVTFNATLSEFSPSNMALALMGSLVEEPAQLGTAVVGEVLSADVVKGASYVLAKIGPYSAVTVTGAGGPLVEYNETTGVGDFRWQDRVIGIIQIVASSAAVADGDEITIGYTPTAYTAGQIVSINGGDSNTIEGSMLYVSDNSVGPKFKIEVWKMSMTPDGAIGVISEEWADFTLRGSVLADPVGHPNNKLFKVTYLP